MITGNVLFHITSRSEWEHALQLGAYRPSSMRDEGFIHLSTAEQWPRTAARFFRGRLGLVLLTIDPSALASEVRYEWADGERFPHLHGPLETSAVVLVETLVPDAEGLLHIAPRETL